MLQFCVNMRKRIRNSGHRKVKSRNTCYLGHKGLGSHEDSDPCYIPSIGYQSCILHRYYGGIVPSSCSIYLIPMGYIYHSATEANQPPKLRECAEPQVTATKKLLPLNLVLLQAELSLSALGARHNAKKCMASHPAGCLYCSALVISRLTD